MTPRDADPWGQRPRDACWLVYALAGFVAGFVAGLGCGLFLSARLHL